MNRRNNADSQWPNFKTCHFGWNLICWWFTKLILCCHRNLPKVTAVLTVRGGKQTDGGGACECMVIMWMQIFGCEDGSVMKTRNGQRDRKIFLSESSNCTLVYSVQCIVWGFMTLKWYWTDIVTCMDMTTSHTNLKSLPWLTGVFEKLSQVFTFWILEATGFTSTSLLCVSSSIYCFIGHCWQTILSSICWWSHSRTKTSAHFYESTFGSMGLHTLWNSHVVLVCFKRPQTYTEQQFLKVERTFEYHQGLLVHTQLLSFLSLSLKCNDWGVMIQTLCFLFPPNWKKWQSTCVRGLCK